MPELLKDLILLVFGQYFGTTMIVQLLIAVLLALWVYKNWRSIPGSKPLSIAFGIWVLAGQLIVQDLLSRYVSTVEAERTEATKPPPPSLASTLREWSSDFDRYRLGETSIAKSKTPAITLTDENNNVVVIGQLDSDPLAIQIVADFRLPAADHQQIMALPTQRAEELLRTLLVELNHVNVGYSVNLAKNRFRISEKIYKDAGLTKTFYSQTVDRIFRAQYLVSTLVQWVLPRYHGRLSEESLLLLLHF